MTIHSNRLVRQESQRTLATTWNDQLAATRDQEVARRTPRSQGAWSAEQARLGSWRSGVGSFRLVGRSPGFISGMSDPSFVYDSDEDSRG